MAAPTVNLIQLIYQILFKSIRHIRRSSVLQALKQTLRYLARYSSGICRLWSTSTHKTSFNDPPSPPNCSTEPSQRLINKSDGRGHEKEALDLIEGFPYTYSTVVNGETIPLNDEIMPSVYPLSGNGIHNTSRTSMTLEASRSAHSLNIARSRNGSRSNLDTNSQLGRSSLLSVNSVVEGDDIIITVQNPGSPTILSSSHADIPLASLHSSYLHPRDASTRPSSPNELELIHGTANSIRLNGGYDTPASSRSSLSVDINNQLTASANDSGVHLPSEIVIERVIIAPSTTEIDAPNVTCLADDHIVPVMPEMLQDLRYRDRPTISKDGCRNFKSNMFTFSDPSPEGWIKYTHPEGTRYFYHPQKRVYSEADLENKQIYDQAMEDIEKLQMHRSSCGYNDEYTDLVIHTTHDTSNPGAMSTIYYYVHHLTSSVLFLDHYDTESLSVNKEIYGPTSWDHLRYEIEAQYWYHVQLYPHSRVLTKESIALLRDSVLHYIGDLMTSPTSLSPYSMQDLRDILDLTKDMDKNIGTVAIVGAQSLLARQMFIFARSKFLHFYGEPHARLERNVSVYGDNVHQRTWLVNCLSPILFFAPDFHLRNLQDMWVDHIMVKSVFQESMKKMNEEWDHFVLFATVMLNANVAFLAIQSVDNNESPQRSAAQISSYVSMFASIGSIVLGLHLSRQNKTKGRANIDSIEEVQRYMESRSHSSLGLETLAILYSLPYALLIWGMVSFFLAVALVCFMHSDTPTRTIIGFCMFSSLVLISWCIWTNWEQEEADSHRTRDTGTKKETAIGNDNDSFRKNASSLVDILPTSMFPSLTRSSSENATAV